MAVIHQGQRNQRRDPAGTKVNRRMSWQEKNVLVTGGSSGLGYAIARAFAEAGARIAIVGLEPDLVESAAKDLRSFTSDVLPLVGDIKSSENVFGFVESVHRHLGTLHVLVNSAGRSMRGTAWETSPEQFRDLMELNFIATVRMTQAFLRDLLQTRGHLVNIGSLAAKAAARYVGAYPATKHAVAAFTQQLRLELGSKGLHVLLVCPGPVARSGTRLYHLEGEDRVPESARAPGAGVKVRAIAPDQLAKRVVRACEKRQPELVVPAKARLLFAISQLSPRLGDWLINRFTPH